MTPPRRLLGLLAWMTALGAAVAGLVLCGRGGLTGPHLGAPGEWQEWARARPPDQAFVALVRLAAIGLCAYLLALSAAATVVRAVGARPLVSVVDGLTLPIVRPLLHALLGTSVAASAVVIGASPASAQEAAPFVTMTRLREPPSAGPPPQARLAAPRPAATWRVRPGDTFWTIARDTVALQLGRTPSEREIASYWVGLVEVNRAALELAGDPDLVFPGQQFRLP